LGRSPGRNMNGTDLIPHLLLRFATRRTALMGSSDPFLRSAASVLSHRGLNIIQSEHGFHSPDFYEEAFVRSRPGLVVLGMGMPRQEQLAVRLRALGNWPCIIVNGGAVLDFLSGRFPRAPWILRVIGLEWTYRLWREPRRLLRRYSIGNLLFLGRTIELMNLQRRSNQNCPRRSESFVEKRF
jgi:exopolysaccharide biosynthesis WecB/TagA/CpsF family protein